MISVVVEGHPGTIMLSFAARRTPAGEEREWRYWVVVGKLGFPILTPTSATVGGSVGSTGRNLSATGAVFPEKSI
jgi:hypothetical protein